MKDNVKQGYRALRDWEEAERQAYQQEILADRALSSIDESFERLKAGSNGATNTQEGWTTPSLTANDRRYLQKTGLYNEELVSALKEASPNFMDNIRHLSISNHPAVNAMPMQDRLKAYVAASLGVLTSEESDLMEGLYSLNPPKTITSGTEASPLGFEELLPNVINVPDRTAATREIMEEHETPNSIDEYVPRSIDEDTERIDEKGLVLLSERGDWDIGMIGNRYVELGTDRNRRSIGTGLTGWGDSRHYGEHTIENITRAQENPVGR